MAVDWKAAEHVADRLGIQTRKLVAGRDDEASREWALKMSSAHNIYAGNGPRAASYLELAVLLGHVVEEPVEAIEGDAAA
jgi:hypothetical protein